jgi:hypothetical protein
MPVDTSAQRPAAPKQSPKSAKPRITQVTPEEMLNSRASGLFTWFQIAGGFSLMRGNFADAGALEEHGPGICKSAALYAEENETAAKYIDYMCQAGPVAVLLSSVMPLAMQLLANHNRIDATKVGAIPGVVAPEVLEMRIKVRMLKEAARAEQEMADAQREYDEMRLRNGEAA